MEHWGGTVSENAIATARSPHEIRPCAPLASRHDSATDPAATRRAATGERMTDDQAQRIAADPRYRRLVQARGRFGWMLSAIMFAAYFGFVALVAFDKAFLAQPVAAGGVTSLGILIGFAIILLAILLTGLYVARANRDYDAALAALRADHDA